MISRECRECGAVYRAKDKRRANLCRPCANKARNDHKNKNYTATKNAQLKWRYGISWDEYMKMMEEQNHQCAVCKKPAKVGKQGYPVLAVDHCHDTKTVRGLLCNECNWAVGLVLDNPNTAKELAEYINKHKRLESNLSVQL